MPMRRIVFAVSLLLITAVAQAQAPTAPVGPPVNPNALHIALSSLLLASVKAAVANAMIANGRAPASNADAKVGAPDYLTSNEISHIVVGPGGVLSIGFTSAVSPDAIGVTLAPKLDAARRAVSWSCVSSSIPEIAKVESECRYVPAAGH